MKLESENSKPSVLTKEEKDDIYKALIFVREIETDLANAKLTMIRGKFFDSMDYLTEAHSKAPVAVKSIQDFVKSLQDKKIW